MRSIDRLTIKNREKIHDSLVKNVPTQIILRKDLPAYTEGVIKDNPTKDLPFSYYFRGKACYALKDILSLFRPVEGTVWEMPYIPEQYSISQNIAKGFPAFRAQRARKGPQTISRASLGSDTNGIITGKTLTFLEWEDKQFFRTQQHNMKMVSGIKYYDIDLIIKVLQRYLTKK